MADIQNEADSHHVIQIQPQHDDLPSRALFDGNGRKDYFELCLPLYEAALKGDWKTAERLIHQNNNVVRVSITINRDTALHIAASTRHTKFVEELVKKMDSVDLELKNRNGNTALCLAAISGNVKIAETMVKKCPNLTMIRGRENMSPLYMAALFGQSEMVTYLYSKTDLNDNECWTPKERIDLLYACVDNNLFDVAIMILDDHIAEVSLATEDNALHALARKTSVFSDSSCPLFLRVFNNFLLGARHIENKRKAMKIVQTIWREVLKLPESMVWDIIRGPSLETEDSVTNPSRLLNVATESGNSTFLVELIRLCPELMWKLDDNRRNIFQVAVLHRQESVYRLLHEIGSMKDLLNLYIDIDGNTILHLAAMKPAHERLNIVPGVAFQIQRELRWFKEVDSMVNPWIRETKNANGMTARALFTEEHAKLVAEGGKWMSDTSTQCMVVAALIATVTFTGGFTVPGGIDPALGTPLLRQKNLFTVFAIADTISLATSSASILIFLSIITSRFAQDDFMLALPLKLMAGLLTLFASILSMMVAFGSSFFLAYSNDHKKVALAIAVLAGIPVILYAILQFPLFVAVIRSTGGSRHLFRPKKHKLY